MSSPDNREPGLDAIAFRALGELSVGMVITRDNEVVYSNAAFSSMTGLESDAIAQKRHPFLGPPLVTTATAQLMQSYLDEPRPSTPLRLDYVRADNLTAWNEVQLIREGPFVTWMHRDVTQQMGTHELWQRYEFLVDTSHQFMALVNPQYAYELVNRSFAAAFDTTPQEVYGTSAATVWGKHMFSSVVSPHLDRSFQGEEVRVIHEVDLPIGGRRFLDMIYTPYKNQEGAVIHVVFVAWDVTKEKMATDAVRDVNRVLEQRVASRTAELQDTLQELEAFNYTIAHDLRSPLRFLKTFTKMLDETCDEQMGDPGRYYVSMIAQGVAEMQHMIDRLLDFSRLSRKPLCLEKCELNEVVFRAKQSVFFEANTQVDIQGLPQCLGDADLLKQVFVNLLQNAGKFSRKNEAPKIDVFAVETTPSMVRICVRDNGHGFHMTHAEAMFAPFKQLDEHSDNQGSGLGLAIVRRIVERHGGRVWAESEEGVEARFYVELRSMATPTPQNISPTA